MRICFNLVFIYIFEVADQVNHRNLSHIYFLVVGTNTKKLEIHGRLGMICHAVLEDLQNVNGNSSSNQYQMFE